MFPNFVILNGGGEGVAKLMDRDRHHKSGDDDENGDWVDERPPLGEVQSRESSAGCGMAVTAIRGSVRCPRDNLRRRPEQ